MGLYMAGERLYMVTYKDLEDLDENGDPISYEGVFPESGLPGIEEIEDVSLVGYLGDGWLIVPDLDPNDGNRKSKPVIKLEDKSESKELKEVINIQKKKPA